MAEQNKKKTTATELLLLVRQYWSGFGFSWGFVAPDKNNGYFSTTLYFVNTTTATATRMKVDMLYKYFSR